MERRAAANRHNAHRVWSGVVRVWSGVVRGTPDQKSGFRLASMGTGGYTTRRSANQPTFRYHEPKTPRAITDPRACLHTTNPLHQANFGVKNMATSPRPRATREQYEIVQALWFTVTFAAPPDAETQIDLNTMRVLLNHPSHHSYLDITDYLDHYEKNAIKTKVSHIIEAEERARIDGITKLPPEPGEPEA